MSKKSIIFLALLIVSPIILYFLRPSDENRIRRLFREGAGALEERKVNEVLSKVSFTYTDEHGLTYLYLKEGMERMFRQINDIKIEYKIEDIRIKEKGAVVGLEVRVIGSYGQERGYIAGDSSGPLHMKFYLEKEHAKWLVARTEGLPVF